MKSIKRQLAAAAICGLWAANAYADVKIGFTAPLSGPAVLIGQDQYDGFMLAVERLNGKLGGQAVTVIREDDQLKPEIGLQAVRKLLEKDNVDALVGLGYTNILMAAMPAIAKSGVVTIATNAGPRALAGANCLPNFFSVAHPNEGPAEAMGVYANQNNYKNAYLIAPNYQAGKEMMDGFKRYYKGKIVDEVYTPLTQMDFSAEIAQIQFSDTDALFFFMPGGSGINLVKQMHQTGLMKKIPTMSVFSIDETTLPALKEQAEGAVTGARWGAPLSSKENDEFKQAFEAKHKRSASMYAAAGYDAANLLNIAIQKMGGDLSNQTEFAKAVKDSGSEFKSVRGAFEFNNNNMPIQNYYAFEVVRSEPGVEMKELGTILTAHKDAYHSECRLQ